MLTTQQLQAIKAAILADNFLNAFPNNSDGAFAIAEALNLDAAPAFFVWSTSVSRESIYNGNPQPENTSWNWSTYKSQSATEQNAWTQMFMGDQANFSKANVRAGVAAIFTGSAQQNAQQAHVLSCGRRQARRIEKILASGTGSTASPATMGFEGMIEYQDVMLARAS